MFQKMIIMLKQMNVLYVLVEDINCSTTLMFLTETPRTTRTRQRRVPEVGQSVRIQLPSAKDGEGSEIFGSKT